MAGMKRRKKTTFVFKINPAQQLYARLGFQVVAETETHYVMRVPNQADAGDGNSRA